MVQPLTVGPLGVNVELALADFPGAPGVRDELAHLWQEVPAVGGPPAARFRLHIGPHAEHADPEPSADQPVATEQVRQQEISCPSHEELMQYVTGRITVEGLAGAEEHLLLLHASAVALPDGAVVGFVAASGAGKTTLARTLGAAYGYVTDETLAVDLTTRDLTTRDLITRDRITRDPVPGDPVTGRPGVVPYRKPLSLVVPGEPKRQCSPADLGLRPLPEAPLRLARIVVIERDPAHAGDPELTSLPLTEAILAIAPQTSRFGWAGRGLHRLAEMLTRTGGAVKVRYSEAATLVDLVPRFLEHGFDGTPGAAWNGPEGQVAEGSAVPQPAAHAWRMPAGIEWLDTDPGRMLVSSHHGVIELAGIGPTLLHGIIAGGEQAEFDALVRRAEQVHGVPPDGDATQAVAETLDQLADLRLVIAPHGWR